MKKYLITLFVLIFVSSVANAYEWTNDARSLFQSNRANIYVINLRTFSAVDKNKNEIIEPEKGEVVGTFNGAAKRLPLLVQQGINTIHLLPITPVGHIKSMGTAGSLYALDSFNRLNSQLDDLSDPASVYTEAKRFVDKAHSYNIRVIVDLPSCGSYDMFLRNPELFATDSNGKPITPVDWKDVRLFKSQNSDGSLNNELFDLHKSFIDMIKGLGVDGVRADVATIKPSEFWQKLIDYARRDDSEFLFVAEASPSWTKPISQNAPFTTYDKLVDVGFDGYLGNFMNYSKFTSANDLFTSYKEASKLGEKLNAKKSILLNFATHDDVSPFLYNPNYASQILWLSATLPGNMYFVNGFATGDLYLYNYINKKATITYTDDNHYHAHKGKLDIFNFSRRPGGENSGFSQEYRMASLFKLASSDILNTEPIILKTSDPNIFAYAYELDQNKIIVILNHSMNKEVSGTVRYNNIDSAQDIIPIKYTSGEITFKKGKFNVKLLPSDIAVFISNKEYSQKK